MKKIDNSSGFTMLEIMVAVIILSLSLLLLLNMSMVALDGNDWANKTTIASQALQSKMEELRSNPTLLSNGHDTIMGIQREWDITTESKFLKKVNIYVRWQDIRNVEKTNEMISYIRIDSI